jgi:uncharacterized membrane protein YjjB (DUF3815 family)
MSIINIHIFKTCISVILSIILRGVIAVTVLPAIICQEVGAGGLVPGTLVHCDVGVFTGIADNSAPIGDWMICSHVPTLGPIIAQRLLADTSGHILEAMLVVTVLASVAAITSILLIIILQIPALARLKPGLAHNLETVIFICLADLNLPGLIPGSMMLLSKPAPHLAWLGGRLCPRGESGGGVVVVAETGVASANITIDTVGGIILHTVWWPMGMIIVGTEGPINTDI